MSESKATRTVAVGNPEGIHARAAIAIAAVARGFDALVTVSKEDRERVKGTDVLQLLSLGATQGQRLRLEATGPQAEQVLDALTELFATNFPEPEPKPPAGQ